MKRFLEFYYFREATPHPVVAVDRFASGGHMERTAGCNGCGFVDECILSCDRRDRGAHIEICQCGAVKDVVAYILRSAAKMHCGKRATPLEHTLGDIGDIVGKRNLLKR